MRNAAAAVLIGHNKRLMSELHAQVAVRSEEPYRIHCYSILRSLAASDLTLGHDFLGAHTIVSPQ